MKKAVFKVKVPVEKTIDYAFAPAIGVDEGETEVLSAACRGTCGGPITGPLDLILIIDRTTSMSDDDLANALDLGVVADREFENGPSN